MSTSSAVKPSDSTGRSLAAKTATVARWVWALLRWVARWSWRHRRLTLGWIVVALVASWVRSEAVAAWLMAGVLVPVGFGVWALYSPWTYERWMAGPSRRRGWKRWLRREWPSLADACGWTRSVSSTRTNLHGETIRSTRTATPRLVRVRAEGSVVTLLVRARRGQTLDALEAGVPALAASANAVSSRCSPHNGSSSVLAVELVMADALSRPREAVGPDEATDTAPGKAMSLGRREVGGDWRVTVAARHTLTAGCAGAGKSSVMWGMVCFLAPFVPSDTVRLWGVDLKHGVELMMGRSLFTVVADTGEDAVQVLRVLLEVSEARGRAMAGEVRTHVPRPGDPLHVLVIDELADLIAYSDREVRTEASRLLAKILTKGRALGVVVAAFVQDPRKEVVGVRNLFTQRVALRLLSSEETTMVLGDAFTKKAPAHRISPHTPGMGWVVDDTGNADRVRADNWPDDLIRAIAGHYAARVHTALPEPDTTDDTNGWDAPPAPPRRATSAGSGDRSSRPARSPRAPRKPRASTRSTGGGESS